MPERGRQYHIGTAVPYRDGCLAMGKAKNYFGAWLICTPTPFLISVFLFGHGNANPHSTQTLRVSDIFIIFALNQLKNEGYDIKES